VVSVMPGSRFSPGERTPSTHYTGDWVGLKPGLDTHSRGKILLYAGDRSPIARSSSPYSDTILTELPSYYHGLRPSATSLFSEPKLIENYFSQTRIIYRMFQKSLYRITRNESTYLLGTVLQKLFKRCAPFPHS
jgi:hypothetical protein